MSKNGNKEEVDRPFLTPTTTRIIAVQLLFFGLLFLPEISIYPVKWAVADLSIVMRTFQEIVDNPAFYGILMLSSVIMLFSFDMRLEEIKTRNGKVSAGAVLIKALSKVFSIYGVLYLLSWFFLVYKLRFMGDVYINDLLFHSLV